MLAVSGCVSIEAPANLVSDTVEVGKSAYKSIKGRISKDSPDGESYVFTYEHIVPDGEIISDSNDKCINGAIEQARKELNIYNVNVNKTTSNTSVVDDKNILECSVFVLKE